MSVLRILTESAEAEDILVLLESLRVPALSAALREAGGPEMLQPPLP
uniref:Uncharacterized protein n=1 Tax=Riboviria sp. TaxID=2585031 RepID=A0A514CYZ0_9VIRU|nr:MAG: hypothetical protein H4Rhizo44651_000003 [Riboviria sp.]